MTEFDEVVIWNHSVKMTSFLGQTTMSMMGPPSPQEVLDRASLLVDQSLQADQNYYDLSQQMLIPKHSEWLFPELSD